MFFGPFVFVTRCVVIVKTKTKTLILRIKFILNDFLIGVLRTLVRRTFTL